MELNIFDCNQIILVNYSILNISVIAAECDELKSTWNNMVIEPTLPQVAGTVLSVSCNPGYELIGDKEVTCQRLQEFTFNTEPQCSECS